jgi:hypothetical protein
MLTKTKMVEFFFGTRKRAALTAGVASAVALGATEGAAALGAVGAQKLYTDAETILLAIFNVMAGKGTEIAAHLIPDLGIPIIASAIAATAKGVYNKFKFGFVGINSTFEASLLRVELLLLVVESERQTSQARYGTLRQ